MSGGGVRVLRGRNKIYEKKTRKGAGHLESRLPVVEIRSEREEGSKGRGMEKPKRILTKRERDKYQKSPQARNCETFSGADGMEKKERLVEASMEGARRSTLRERNRGDLQM